MYCKNLVLLLSPSVKTKRWTQLRQGWDKKDFSSFYKVFLRGVFTRCFYEVVKINHKINMISWWVSRSYLFAFFPTTNFETSLNTIVFLSFRLLHSESLTKENDKKTLPCFSTNSKVCHESCKFSCQTAFSTIFIILRIAVLIRILISSFQLNFDIETETVIVIQALKNSFNISKTHAWYH